MYDQSHLANKKKDRDLGGSRCTPCMSLCVGVDVGVVCVCVCLDSDGVYRGVEGTLPCWGLICCLVSMAKRSINISLLFARAFLSAPNRQATWS